MHDGKNSTRVSKSCRPIHELFLEPLISSFLLPIKLPQHQQDRQTYSLLEGSNLLVGHGVRLGDDGDQVDLLVKTLHELNIESLERVTGGGDEVQASVDAGVGDLAAVDSVLLVEVGIETALDGFQDGLPAILKMMQVEQKRKRRVGWNRQKRKREAM